MDRHVGCDGRLEDSAQRGHDIPKFGRKGDDRVDVQSSRWIQTVAACRGNRSPRELHLQRRVSVENPASSSGHNATLSERRCREHDALVVVLAV